MTFEVGHELWKNRKTVGRRRKYGSPKKLWDDCFEYFDWVKQNPLCETKAFVSMGEVIKTTIPKPRAMTQNALYLYLQIDRATWNAYAKDRGEQFKFVCETIEGYILAQKIEGAAAGLFNANIIMRETGLKDNIAHQVTGIMASIDAGDDPVKAQQAYLDFLSRGTQLQEP